MSTLTKEQKDAAEAAQPVDEPATEPADGALTGFTDGLAWERHQFRGVMYKVSELEIGDYDDIVKKATRKEKRTNDDTGATEEVEILDQQLQSRLMLKACIVEPAKVDIPKLGTRLTVALNRIVNTLHYGEEPDELKPPKKADDDDGEEKKPGNG